MMYEKLVYTNERGESIELSVGSVYHCNVSKDVDEMHTEGPGILREN